MLFCRKCGNIVEKGDKFCISCMSRLDAEGAVLCKEEYSLYKSSLTNEFDPDNYICNASLSGCVVLGHRLTDRICSVLGADHYKAVSADISSEADVIVRHFALVTPEERDICAVLHRLHYDEADRLAEQFAEAVCRELLAHNALCVRAGIPSLNYTAQHLYSGLYNKHHVFALTKSAVPFIEYFRVTRITMRRAIRMCIDIAAQLLKLRGAGSAYGTFTDNVLFVSDDGCVFIDAHIDRLYESFYPYTARSMYNRMFMPRFDTGHEVYSLAIILYRLLSGFNHPYINPHKISVSNEDISAAEVKRVKGERPILPDRAYNMLGNKIADILTADAADVTLEDMANVLENSLNYIPACELDSFIN